MKLNAEKPLGVAIMYLINIEARTGRLPVSLNYKKTSSQHARYEIICILKRVLCITHKISINVEIFVT